MNQFPAQTLPSKKFMDILGEYAGQITPPALKLKLISRVIEKYSNESKFYYKFIPQFDEIVVRRLIHKEFQAIKPGTKVSFQDFITPGRFKSYQRLLWNLYPFRRSVFSVFFVLFLCLSIWGVNSLAHAYMHAAALRKASAGKILDEVVKNPDPIWLVEQSEDLEVYSNRLRIITSETVSHVERNYLVFPKSLNQLPGVEKTTNHIKGILYHSSESDILPLSEKLNNNIKKSSMQLLKYVQRIKSYNYLIDRYGRVYRIIPDSQAAFHAGNSIWADDETIYLNLNHAFIGICFEGRDFAPKGLGITAKDHSSINDVQIKSARELTDWLRFKYKINEMNCVSHGLTSINPTKKLIGYHMDLAKGFPFSKMGLSDKYNVPLPSMVLFGFTYDDYYLSVFKNRLCEGIRISEKKIQEKAGSNHLNAGEYRRILNNRFSVLSAWQALIEKENPALSSQSTMHAMGGETEVRSSRKRLRYEFDYLKRYR